MQIVEIMLRLLESTHDIRNTLGDTYNFIKSFDILSKERSKTKYFRKQLERKYSRFCASCGQSNKHHQLYVAHILALEEGGKTENDNLVLLCRDCHTLYDNGYASLREMEEAAASWRNGECANLQEQMVKRNDSFQSYQPIARPLLEGFGALEGSLYNLIQGRKYIKALNALRKARESCTSLEARQVLAIVEAQIQRRRAAQGSLEIANRLLEKVEIDRLPVDRKPLYFYERGYIKQLLGLAGQASQCFLKSYEFASDLRDKYAPLETLIARGQYLAAQVISLGVESTQLQNTAGSICREYDIAAQLASKLEAPFSGRWELNCKIWKVNLLLKSRNHRIASKCFREALDLRNKQDVTLGWTAASRPTITALRGLILMQPHSSQKHVEEGLHLLARALVPILEGHRQRPEGIRDHLLGFEKGLGSFPCKWKIDFGEHVKKIEITRARIKDGSSFLDPYHAC